LVPYCRNNTKALAEAQTKIAAGGAQIVAIMPDRQQFAATFKSEAKDASAERLQAFADAVRRLGPYFQEAVARLERLKEQGVVETAPRPGETMPRFVLPDETGHLVSLDKLLAKGPVAITFHRGHWCPYCRINTRALAEAQNEIAAEGAQIAATSSISPRSSKPSTTRRSRF
jgi:peroxiredoxin